MGWHRKCARCHAEFGGSGSGRPRERCTRCGGRLRAIGEATVGHPPPSGQVVPNTDDELPVTCWCQATVVLVARRDMLAGLTLSCGAPECVPTEAAS